MDYQLIVEVTQEDIDGGVAQDASSCAIAHAYKRMFPDLMGVVVGVPCTTFWLEWEEGGGFAVDTPQPAIDFIMVYDGHRPGEHAQPTSFVVPLDVDQAQLLGLVAELPVAVRLVAQDYAIEAD